ncbi:class C sortase [Paeniglutamicibacter sp. NPDC091659]|uniref:class C sortase n=1 Tax=Paeniglutamicibacter sp. NPDC091659 TaxID=3364389 RepID=UPI0038251282
MLTVVIAVMALGCLASGLYPMAASWVSSYNQSKIISGYESRLDHVKPSVSHQMAKAKQYNDALNAGVVLEKSGNMPIGIGASSNPDLEYEHILSSGSDGMIGRIKISSVHLDLPIYHGTSDALLQRGAGHVEGSHLPIGGKGKRSVITAHRGLANATMFSNLNKVKVDDTFTMEVFGEVLAYRVHSTKVIGPEDTVTLSAVPGEDLVTLVTSTPLGINTHRILVTGERIKPTPIADIQAAGEVPTIPGFPWWIVLALTGFGLTLAYFINRGFADAKSRSKRLAAASG